MTSNSIGKLALLWRGDPATRRQATQDNNRWHAIFAALAAQNIHAEPAVYCEELADELRAQLLQVNGVLVWVNPIQDGRPRFELDAVLREIASRGIWVSTHPDVTNKMGVKEVLYTTRHLGWGTDTRRYPTYAQFRHEFPDSVQAAGPRVVKQNRGNGGQGVWRVAAANQAPGIVSVLEAPGGSVSRDVTLDKFMSECESYFSDVGCIIDQAFQPRLPDGMIRCYMGLDKVVGFGHQHVTALIPPSPAGPDEPPAQPGPRIMHAATAPEFRALRLKMENEWVPQMMRLFELDRDALPIIWDADFLYGPRDAAGDETYVLCEINVSSVFPIPEQAATAIALLVKERLASQRTDMTRRVGGRT